MFRKTTFRDVPRTWQWSKGHDNVDESPIIWVDASGTSMMPIIEPGWKIGIEMNRLPDFGDLMYFRAGQSFLLHRCLDIRLNERDEREYLEKGDALYVANWINESQILGVVRYIDTGEQIYDWFNTRWRSLAQSHIRLARLARRLGYRYPDKTNRFRRLLPSIYREILAWKGRRILRKLPHRSREVLSVNLPVKTG